MIDWANPWRDPRVRPGLQKIDYFYGWWLLASIVLFAICAYSYTHHWPNVGIAAIAILWHIAFFALLAASSAAKKEHIQTMGLIFKDD